MALEIHPLVRRSLGDHDPGVVWAAVEVYQQLAIVGSFTECLLIVHSVISCIHIDKVRLSFWCNRHAALCTVDCHILLASRCVIN